MKESIALNFINIIKLGGVTEEIFHAMKLIISFANEEEAL
jgi:hypothetical protein